MAASSLAEFEPLVMLTALRATTAAIVAKAGGLDAVPGAGGPSAVPREAR